MTYEELLEELKKLDNIQLKQTVSLLNNHTCEIIPVNFTDITVENDVLDEDHFILIHGENPND